MSSSDGKSGGDKKGKACINAKKHAQKGKTSAGFIWFIIIAVVALIIAWKAGLFKLLMA